MSNADYRNQVISSLVGKNVSEKTDYSFVGKEADAAGSSHAASGDFEPDFLSSLSERRPTKVSTKSANVSDMINAVREKKEERVQFSSEERKKIIENVFDKDRTLEVLKAMF